MRILNLKLDAVGFPPVNSPQSALHSRSNFDAINNRYAKDGRAYEEIRDSVMPKVTRWKYYAEDIRSWSQEDPVMAEKTVSKGDAEYSHGYDSNGNLIVVLKKMHVGHTEEFIRYSKNTVEISNFYERELRYVETLTLKNGQQVKMENKYGTSARIDHYEWEGNTMIKILTQWSDDHCLTEFHRVEEGDGMLAMFRIRPDGTRRAMHQPLPKGVTIKSLAESIRTHLVKGLYEAVSKIKLKEPIYCIALVYSGEGNPVFPVTFEIGLESQRQKLIKEHGKEAKHIIWSPEDAFTHSARPIVVIDDPEYEQASEWYSDAMMAKSSDAPAIKLINEIAAELAKLDWSKIAPITKDFVVFAVDLETGDLQKNMKKSVPAPLLKDLKARNLI